jgi:hypothetical protein
MISPGTTPTVIISDGVPLEDANILVPSQIIVAPIPLRVQDPSLSLVTVPRGTPLTKTVTAALGKGETVTTPLSLELKDTVVLVICPGTDVEPETIGPSNETEGAVEEPANSKHPESFSANKYPC